ncbi:hypothetical protein C2W64_01433 [Brevibacillus laterosporus]|uniref:Uncharacterized protein n=1 Tax=Brevibacillus laterosporus TaxID=1465 RepID=A0A518V639_BRELA|nr:hypothetical protein [Brevibacillus laterosporus]QDX92487.1 hypothetical protein EEL30_09220 [Brevibacillus laterosporus]RAP26717.1 hypothetical protein C2W64_01433 [Brevibacillus laterosporus]
MLKKMTSLMMVFALICSMFGIQSIQSVRAESSNLLYDEKNPILDIEGNEIGEEIEKVYREVTKDSEETLVKLITITENKYYNDENENTTDRKVTEIKITNDKKFFINGEQLSQDFLNQPVTASEDRVSFAKAFKGESGGRAGVITYNEINDDYYYLKAFPKVNDFLEEPSGKGLVKYSNGNGNASKFIRYADKVDSKHADIIDAQVTIASMIGAALVTWETVILLLPEAGVAGWNAVKLYNASNAGKEALKDAYDLLKNKITPY